MANTWTLYRAGDWSGGSGTVLLGLMNESAARVLKVRRIGVTNTEDGSVGSAVKIVRVVRYSSTATWTGHTPIAPMAHDTQNSALVDYKAGHGGTEGGGAGPHIFRQYYYSADEPVVGGISWDNMETLVPLGIIFDAAHGESEMQPLTLREDESCICESLAASGTQDTDFWMEFTDE